MPSRRSGTPIGHLLNRRPAQEPRMPSALAPIPPCRRPPRPARWVAVSTRLSRWVAAATRRERAELLARAELADRNWRLMFAELQDLAAGALARADLEDRAGRGNPQAPGAASRRRRRSRRARSRAPELPKMSFLDLQFCEVFAPRLPGSDPGSVSHLPRSGAGAESPSSTYLRRGGHLRGGHPRPRRRLTHRIGHV